MKLTISINPKVTLTKAQIADFNKHIVAKGNMRKACAECQINYRTFLKALKSKPITAMQKNNLIAFCELIKKEKAVA